MEVADKVSTFNRGGDVMFEYMTGPGACIRIRLHVDIDHALIRAWCREGDDPEEGFGRADDAIQCYCRRVVGAVRSLAYATQFKAHVIYTDPAYRVDEACALREAGLAIAMARLHVITHIELAVAHARAMESVLPQFFTDMMNVLSYAFRAGAFKREVASREVDVLNHVGSAYIRVTARPALPAFLAWGGARTSCASEGA